MAKALTTDLRRRVVDAAAQGMSCRQAAERFGVSASSAIRWVVSHGRYVTFQMTEVAVPRDFCKARIGAEVAALELAR